MSRRLWALAAVALLLLTLALLGWLRSPAPLSPPAETAPPVRRSSEHAPHSAARPAPAALAPGSAAEVSPLAEALNAPAGTIDADLRILDDVIHAFRTNFPRAGNPTGTNAEITAALAGKNPLRLALIPPQHAAINRDGELCDRWGTPFFFHAESATRMAIRSAGPDKKMWTEDDAVFTP
jgi:hypothetical protein